MNNKFKKAVALTAAACLCISTGYLSASALSAKDRLNGRTSDFVYLQNGVHEFINTENFFGNYGYDEKATQIYVPGDTISGSVEVGNDYSDAVNIYLYAANASDDKYQAYAAANTENTDYTWQQLKAISGRLISQITLTVWYKPQSGTETVVYRGHMDGTSGMNTVNAIDLGKYATGDRGTLRFELKIPKELNSVSFSADGVQLGRGYNGAVGMIDWVFTCSQNEPPVSSEPIVTQPSQTTPTTGYVTPTDPPKPHIPSPGTGDEAIPYIIGAVVCGVSALAIILVVFNSRKKDNDE